MPRTTRRRSRISLGRPATGTDLYMAHFLGLGGADKFLSAMADSPGRAGACAVPRRRAHQSQRLLRVERPAAHALGDLCPLRRQARSGRGRGGAAGIAADGLDAGFDAGFDAAARAWSAGDNEVVLGNGAVDRDRHWVQNTLAQLNVRRARRAIRSAAASIRSGRRRKMPASPISCSRIWERNLSVSAIFASRRRRPCPEELRRCPARSCCSSR